jgi:hypothetical protein
MALRYLDLGLRQQAISTTLRRAVRKLAKPEASPLKAARR